MSAEQEIWDALKALLSATNLGADVYDYGTVPGESGVDPSALPDTFALMSIERRYVEPNKASGIGRTGWRVSVRYVDQNAYNARLAGAWVREAFETDPGHGKRITVGGIESTPLTHESTTAVEPDDGRFSGLVVYTLAL